MEKEREKQLAKAIGQAIARKRAEAKLTQEEVAHLLQIGPEAMSRMERGTTMPTVSRLVDLADILNCPVADFLTEVSDRSQDQELYLFRKLNMVGKDNRESLLKAVDILIKGMKKQ